MPWYKVTLSDDDILAGKLDGLQNAFAVVFLASGGPVDAGMFSPTNLGRAPECYFSPGAARIGLSVITAFGGVECDAPSRVNMAILVANRGFEGKPFAD